jgi:hypothetical protein
VSRDEAGQQARIVASFGAPEQGQPRPGERVGISGGRLEQQRYQGLGQQVACVLCKVGQQQQRAGVAVASGRDERDIGAPAKAGGERRVIAGADQAPGFGRVLQRGFIHDAY